MGIINNHIIAQTSQLTDHVSTSSPSSENHRYPNLVILSVPLLIKKTLLLFKLNKTSKNPLDYMKHTLSYIQIDTWFLTGQQHHIQYSIVSDVNMGKLDLDLIRNQR